MSKTFRVGILGATGAVGQRFLAILNTHPWFEVTDLCASTNSAGKTYRDAVNWRVPAPFPEAYGNLVVRTCTPSPDHPVDLVFSALPSDEAKTVEPAFAKAGVPVVSNASAYRMGPLIPLLIPEVNPHHLELIEKQRKAHGWDGFIVTNPNCATIGIVPALKALDDAFGIDKVSVVTMQARSGAGYPGPSEEVIGDNVVPYINNEEDKLETEPQKIMGAAETHASFKVSASCHRVDVSDGHLETISVSFKRKPENTQHVVEALSQFTGEAADLDLPTAPKPVIIVHAAQDRPQPKLDRDAGNGMAISVGRVRPCSVFDYKMEVLSHNTVRGAAGAAVLNAELLIAKGFIN